MFTETDRGELLQELIIRARADPAIDAAALVGSTARGTTDRWSDIDLALGLADEAGVIDTAAAWTRSMSRIVAVADTLDVWAGPVLYRVFLLHHSLQVDLSFWPAGSLAGTGTEPLALVFGQAAASTPVNPPDPRGVLGWGWLYALHARSAIARGRSWRALQMLEGLRNQVLVLSCLRHGLQTHHGRGVDQLPLDLLTALSRTLPVDLTSRSLGAAYATAIELIADEAEHLDADIAARLRGPLTTLRTTTAAAVC